MFREGLEVALALLREGGVFGIGHPAHHAFVAFGAHLRGEFAAALDRGIARRGGCCGGGSVTHTGILYRPNPTYADEDARDGIPAKDENFEGVEAGQASSFLPIPTMLPSSWMVHPNGSSEEKMEGRGRAARRRQ